jgi:hypothetical protein
MSEESKTPTTASEDLLGSPIAVKLGKRDLLLSPLSLGAMGTLKRQAKDFAEKELDEKLAWLKKAGIDTAENKKELVGRYFADLDNGSMESNYLATLDGLGQALWLSLRVEQADVTLEFVNDNVKSRDVPYWQNKLDEVTYPAQTDGEAKRLIAEEEAKRAAGAAASKPGDDPNAQAPAAVPLPGDLKMPGMGTIYPNERTVQTPAAAPGETTTP